MPRACTVTILSVSAARPMGPPGRSYVKVQQIMPNSLMVSAVWLASVSRSG